MASKHYVAPNDVYVDSVLHKAGTPFVFTPTKDNKAGADWEVVTPKAAAAMEAGTEKVPDDADLEALDKSALLAVAFLRRVPGLKELKTDDALRQAIRVSYEPAL